MAERDAFQVAMPDVLLRRLDRLVGTWHITGGTTGQVCYEWMEGGFFLIQHVDLDHDGHKNRGIEIIGRERRFGAAAPGDEIRSRFYSSTGDTLDYVYEMDGDTLTIWGGERGSQAYFRGKLVDGDQTLVGRWVWPGGGYESTARRVG